MSDWSTIKKMIWLRRTAIGTTYTLTGPVVSFSTFRSAPLLALTAAIAPIQSGTGDPSPDNVRPITGRTGTTVTHTGKNIFTGWDRMSSGNAYSEKIPVAFSLNQYYTISGLTNTINCYIWAYDANDTLVGRNAGAKRTGATV